MTKLVMKLVIFVLGIFIGLLLREFRFVNNNIMPLIYENQILVGLLIVSIIGFILIVIIQD